jgi:hypothetical protein
MLDSEEEVGYVRTPAKRLKMTDSEADEEGNRRILSKFSKFRSIAYFRHLSDHFGLICHAVRMNEKNVCGTISLTYFVSSHFLPGHIFLLKF